MGKQADRTRRVSATPRPRMRGIIRCLQAACWPALLLPALLGACHTHEPLGRIVIPGGAKATDPPLNPHPRHVVRLHGSAPGSLDFRFRVSFVSTVEDGDCWNHAGFWEGGGEKAFAYDIHPVRNGPEWKADLVVDRHLPGACGWDLNAGVTIFVKPADKEWTTAGLQGGVLSVIGDARGLDDTTLWCEPGRPTCDTERARRLANADEAVAVELHCRWKSGEDTIGDDLFLCSELHGHKILHYVREHTRSVRIDLHDHGTAPIPPTGLAGVADE